MLILGLAAIQADVTTTCRDVRTIYQDSNCCTGSDDAVLHYSIDDTSSLQGQTVKITGALIGPDATVVNDVLASWATKTGIQATYTGSQAFEDEIQGLMQTNSPDKPDIALWPQPGAITDAARNEYIVPITRMGVDLEALRSDFSPYLMKLGEVDTVPYGVPMAANLKSMVWYQPWEFEKRGYSIPQTWEEMIQLSDRIVTDGMNPWCVAIYSNGATGWVATDWVEDILLRDSGVDVYDQWLAREIPFNASSIQDAVSKYSQIVHTPNYVAGGVDAVATTYFGMGLNPMLERDESGNPKCFMHRQASFITMFLPPDKQPLLANGNLTFFPFPKIDESLPSTALGGGDMFAALNERDATSAVYRFLASKEFGEAMASHPMNFGRYSANHRVPADSYGSDIAKRTAQTLSDAIRDGAFRFDASDLMHPVIGAGKFWTEMTKLTKQEITVSEALNNVEAAYQAIPPPSPPTPSCPPTSEDTSVAKIQERGHLICGVSGSTLGFSEEVSPGKFEGIDAEFCEAIALVVLGDRSKVRFEKVVAATRFDMLKSGSIDALARVSTSTMVRELNYDITFPFLNFYDGGKVMTTVANVQDLQGKTICTNLGSSMQFLLPAFSAMNGLNLNIEMFEAFPQCIDRFIQGLNDGVASDESGLGAYRYFLNKTAWNIVPETPFTKEPLGVAVRAADAELAFIVKWIGQILVLAEEEGVGMATSADAVMNPFLKTLMANNAPSFAGLTNISSTAFGQVISTFGNYGEMFQRSLGSMGFARGMNALYRDGGLMYAQPIGNIFSVLSS